MSFWRFIRSSFTSAFRLSWHGGHLVHQTCVLLAGGLLVFSAIRGVQALSHEEEPKMLIVAPLVAAVLLFLGSLFWCAYSLYREEYDRRVAAEGRLVPVLEIRGIGPRSDGHHRIRVHNSSQ